MSNKIEIKIEAKRLTPEKFLEAAENFFGLIQGVTKNVAHKPVNWAIEVDKGSAIVRAIVPEPDPEAEECVSAISRGINSLLSGAKIIPFGFTAKEIRATKNLVELKDGENISSISIANDKAIEELSEKIIPIAEVLLQTQSHKAFGSVEGRINSFSFAHALCCTIYEPIYRREIVCYILKKEDAKNLFDAATRKAKVLAGGLIHYSKEGYPVNISADSFEVFPEESNLPTLQEVQEIYRQYK